MKRKIVAFLLAVGCCCACFINTGVAYAGNRTVLLGGLPAGFNMQTRGAFIAGLSDVITEDGIKSPSKDAGLKAGDVIYYIENTEVNCAKDVERVISLTGGEITVEYSRCGNTYTTEITPVKDLNGDKKLGIFIRDDISGIGTITYIDKDRIATLGHPVLDENGDLLKITTGKIYGCNITGYIRGERGAPGELRGVIMKNDRIGTIDGNTDYGVFGTIDDTFDTENFKEIEVGEGKMGDAVIYTTIDGSSPKEYSISIIKVDNTFSDSKNYVVKITDKELLNSTGGIVQGMSGSPIVQNGKLIGAITHVFINDPTRGFGISINNMLNK
ncbi:MAG: SpoIVB peptidase [Clostridia bacterium]|nr:SpoIVB peptidase [Clostridia bacterium]